jgi:hypothetical protein
MKKLIPIAVILAVLISACSSSDRERESAGDPTQETNASEVTMDNGPLIAKELDVNDLVVTASLPGCANEEFPVQGETFRWDFDKDGASDAVVVSRCPTGDERTTLSIARATSRGWWPVLNIGGLEDTFKLTGNCKINGDNLRCPVDRLNPDTMKNELGSIEVFYSANAIMYRFLVGE